MDPGFLPAFLGVGPVMGPGGAGRRAVGAGHDAGLRLCDAGRHVQRRGAVLVGLSARLRRLGIGHGGALHPGLRGGGRWPAPGVCRLRRLPVAGEPVFQRGHLSQSQDHRGAALRKHGAGPEPGARTRPRGRGRPRQDPLPGRRRSRLAPAGACAGHVHRHPGQPRRERQRHGAGRAARRAAPADRARQPEPPAGWIAGRFAHGCASVADRGARRRSRSAVRRHPPGFRIAGPRARLAAVGRAHLPGPGHRSGLAAPHPRQPAHQCPVVHAPGGACCCRPADGAAAY